MSSPAAKAEQLKTEGNALFEKNDYSRAYEKYSAAIDEDGTNAILYSNRAACSLATKKYLDASGDAKKATELNPKFSKAWARLATAADELGSFKQSIPSWKRAIEFLDMAKPTSAKLKETYEASLKRAETRLENVQCLAHHLTPELTGKSQLPWERAGLLVPLMKENGVVQSSAYVIHSAHEAFRSGWSDIEELQMFVSKDGKMKATQVKSTDALSRVVDGILRDRRIFNVTAGPEWMELLNAQIRAEIDYVGGWVDSGPEILLEEAQVRLRTEGWTKVRSAICTTVRAWVLRAFVIGGFQHDWPSAIKWYETALQVIERGRKIWQKVPKKDRGAVFDNGFFLGVRGLHMEAYFQAFEKGPGEPTYTTSTLMKLAITLEQDTKRWKPNAGDYINDIGAMYGYFVYPKAEAIGIKAFCYKDMARKEMKDISKCCSLAHQGAKYYKEAAEIYPLDEERRAFYLTTCLTLYWECGHSPVGELLPICQQLRERVPRMRGIWQHSSMQMQGNRQLLDMILSYDDDMKRLIEQKHLQPDENAKPWFVTMFPLPKSRCVHGKYLPNGMNVGKPRITNS